MASTTVTRKGQVTIPKEIRQRLGLHEGARVTFTLVEGGVELRPTSAPPVLANSGFGMVQVRRPSVPADFDPASLVRDGGAAP